MSALGMPTTVAMPSAPTPTTAVGWPPNVVVSQASSPGSCEIGPSRPGGHERRRSDVDVSGPPTVENAIVTIVSSYRTVPSSTGTATSSKPSGAVMPSRSVGGNGQVGHGNRLVELDVAQAGDHTDTVVRHPGHLCTRRSDDDAGVDTSEPGRRCVVERRDPVRCRRIGDGDTPGGSPVDRSTNEPPARGRRRRAMHPVDHRIGTDRLRARPRIDHGEPLGRRDVRQRVDRPWSMAQGG